MKIGSLVQPLVARLRSVVETSFVLGEEEKEPVSTILLMSFPAEMGDGSG